MKNIIDSHLGTIEFSMLLQDLGTIVVNEDGSKIITVTMASRQSVRVSHR